MSDEFDKNQNETNNIDAASSNSPQYSFWAEQTQQTQNAQSDQSAATHEGTNAQAGPQMGSPTYPNYERVNYTAPNYNGGYQQNGYQQNGYQANGYQQPPFGQQSFASNEPPKKNRRKVSAKAKKTGAFVCKAVCGGLIAGACFAGVVLATNSFAGNGNGGSALQVGTANTDRLSATTVLDDAVVPDTDVTSVYENVLPSIVAIDSTISETYSYFGQSYQEESTGSGSGIIVGETDTELLIATNNHVVDGATKIMITFIDGTQAEAVTKGTDSEADLAVVSIDITTLDQDTIDAIKVATLGDSDTVKEGEVAIAIGNALGYGQSITVGYISALNREVEFDTGTMTLLQTDAAINPGNSGGALLNSDGEVIGINCAKLATDSVEGMGYAIPISKAIPIINELMSREIIKEADQGYLGVSIIDITEDMSTTYGMPVGVYIRDFTDDSAAQEAGLQTGDIITAIDDVEVSTSSSLKEKVISYKYGTSVTVTYQRSVDGTYEEQTLDVVLGKKPTTEDSSSEDSTDGTDNSQSGEATTPDSGEITIPDNGDSTLPDSGDSSNDGSGSFFNFGNGDGSTTIPNQGFGGTPQN